MICYHTLAQISSWQAACLFAFLAVSPILAASPPPCETQRTPQSFFSNNLPAQAPAPARTNTQTMPKVNSSKSLFFKLLKNGDRLGSVEIELEREDLKWKIKSRTSIYSDQQESLILIESHYRVIGEKVQLELLNVSTAQETPLLEGELKVDTGKLIESWKVGNSPQQQKEHLYDDQAIVTVDSFPFLAARLLQNKNRLKILFPTIPKTFHGPIISSNELSYILRRQDLPTEKKITYTIQGQRPQAQRSVTLITHENGRILSYKFAKWMEYKPSTRVLESVWRRKMQRKIKEQSDK